MSRRMLGVGAFGVFFVAAGTARCDVFFRTFPANSPGAYGPTNLRKVSGDGHLAVGDSGLVGPRVGLSWSDVPTSTVELHLPPASGPVQLVGVSTDGLTIATGIWGSGISWAGFYNPVSQTYHGVSGGLQVYRVGGLSPTGSHVLGGYNPNGYGIRPAFLGQDLNWVIPAPNGPSGVFVASSVDMSVVVGNTFAYQSFRWTQQSGVQFLPTISGQSFVNAITSDGQTIVGETGGRPALWAADGTITQIPWTHSSGTTGAYCSSSTASVIGGGIGHTSPYDGTTGPAVNAAFLWTASTGARSLQDVLQEAGFNVAGWRFTRVLGMSDDGATIVAEGASPSGTFYQIFARVPVPVGCDSIDFNNDTLFPDTADIADFLSVFAGGACSTSNCSDLDFNNDGLFPDTLDISALLSVFGGGPCL